MSGSRFPLTPALSPGRGRIDRSQLAWRKWFGISEAAACCSLFFGERVRVRGQPGPAPERSHAAGFADQLTRILPRPAGEGRGEGKPDARNAARAQKQIRAPGVQCLNPEQVWQHPAFAEREARREVHERPCATGAELRLWSFDCGHDAFGFSVFSGIFHFHTRRRAVMLLTALLPSLGGGSLSVQPVTIPYALVSV